MKFELCTIASGSSGNCIYIGTDKNKLLVDAGISGKKITTGLTQIGVNPEEIEGVLITHEHIDHIQGAGIISRKYNYPIYATKGTWEYILQDGKIGKIKEENIRMIESELPLYFGDLKVTPYDIHHDASQPVGYTFSYQNKKMSIATDLGYVDERILGHLKDSHLVLLESNHDVGMLEAGPYPYHLKKRILGDRGHLSNEVAAKALLDIYSENLQYAVLGHLSSENNFPDLAYITAKNTLEEKGIQIGKDLDISVAKRDGVSNIYNIL